MKDHLIHSCSELAHICKTCGDRMYRGKPHNCVAVLLRRLEDTERELQTTRDRFDAKEKDHQKQMKQVKGELA